MGGREMRDADARRDADAAFCFAVRASFFILHSTYITSCPPIPGCTTTTFILVPHVKDGYNYGALHLRGPIRCTSITLLVDPSICHTHPVLSDCAHTYQE